VLCRGGGRLVVAPAASLRPSAERNAPVRKGAYGWGTWQNFAGYHCLVCCSGGSNWRVLFFRGVIGIGFFCVRDGFFLSFGDCDGAIRTDETWNLRFV
jgi:hypothetical protein